AARTGVSAFALPITALAGHAPCANCASGQARLSVVTCALRPAGRVIWTVRALAWPAGDSTTVCNVGSAFLAPGAIVAASVGAKASLSQPVGVKAAEPEPCVPS